MQNEIKALTICGGVSANSQLRLAVKDLGEELGLPVFVPKLEYCTDNAAMIAIAAHFKFQEGQLSDQSVRPMARLAWL